MEKPMPRGATFIGPTAQQMVSHPSPSATGDPFPGPIIGFNIDNNKPFRLDPFWLMENQIINAMTMLIIAAIRDGKSALIKMLTLRLMRLAPGGRALQGVINDYRPEGNTTEYGKLAAYLECDQVRMRDMRFDILDPRLYMNDRGQFSVFAFVEMIRRIAEFEQDPLSDTEMLALRVTMHDVMKTDSLLWDFDHIARISGGIEESMYNGFRGDGEKITQAELDKRLAKVTDLRVKEQVDTEHRRVMSLPDNTSLAELKVAGVSLRNRIDGINHLVAGGVFGKDHSFYDLQTQQLSVRDWRGLPPATERLLKLVFGRFDIASIDNNRRDLIPDLVIDDERHRAMRNHQYVKDLLYRQQITRSLGSVEVGATHTHDSVRTGEPGSDLYRDSETILNNTGVHLYGRIPDEPGFKRDVKRFTNMKDEEVDRLTTIPQYCFGVKFNQSRPLEVFRTAPFGDDFDLIFTDSATRDKAEGMDMEDQEAMETFARQNGAQYTGGEG